MTPRLSLPLATMVAVAMLISSCSGPGVVHEWQQEALEFTLEGPLFEGPNSGQVTLELDLPAALGAAEGQEVADARLVTATVHPADSMGFDHVRSFVLSFASDNADVPMQEAAFKNPVPEEAASVALDVAAQAELGAHFAEDRVYLVLDVDLAEDLWDGYRSFVLDYTMEITLK